MPSLKPTEHTHLRRIVFMATLSVIAFGVILVGYCYLQIGQYDFYTKKSQFLSQRTHEVKKITPLRGTIYSSMGTTLATSNYRKSVYLAPNSFKDERKPHPKEEDERKMRRAALLFGRSLGINPQMLEKKFEKNRDFLLTRNIDDAKIPDLLGICMELDLPSKFLYQMEEGQRTYPQGELAAHVVGLTQRDAYGDNIGLSGAEVRFNADIAGKMVDMEEGETRLTLEEARERASGNDVYLTIHDAIQQYAQSALKSQVEKFEAKGGVCVVMEVGTGAILAMASYPEYDLNNPAAYSKTSQANRCLMYAISPGSVMKVFTTAALLENGKLNPSEMVDCHGGSISFPLGRNETRKIKDSHELGVVTVMKAFAESSNVAYTILGQRLEREVFSEYLQRLGFGHRTGIDLLGESGGILHPANKWTLSSRISIPIGYEMTGTAVQITAAMAGLANNGQYVKPHILKEIRSPRDEVIRKAVPELGARVCSPQTSKTLLEMMEQVVLHGTGKEAAIPGFRVGGKTGTTRKDKRGDSDERLYYASFIGVIPLESPRLVIYTWVDEPKNEKYGSTIAAPIFRMVAEHATRVLNIQPTQPINTGKVSADEEDVEVIDKVVVDSLPSLPIVPREMGDGEVLMPNLIGKTVKGAVDELSRLKVECDLEGTGVVVQQYPEANLPLSKGDHAVIILGERTQE